MIHRMAAYIAQKLSPYCEDRDKLLMYGLDTLLHTILSTFGLIVIGYMFDELGACIMIIAIYYVNQTFASCTIFFREGSETSFSQFLIDFVLTFRAFAKRA